MDPKLFITVFFTVLFAELADKMQLATLMYSASHSHKTLTIFLGSALALVLSAAVAVLIGAFLSKQFPIKILSWIAGVGFIVVGFWTILKT